MLTVVKRDEQELHDFLESKYGEVAEKLEKFGFTQQTFLSHEAAWLMTFGRLNGRPLKLEPYQVGFMLSRAPKRSVNKSRQIGYSFETGLEAMARAHMKDKHTAVFVSYNLEDAKEKINIIREVHDELPLEFQKKIVNDTKTELCFQSNSSAKRLSRIISYPSKAPRGKSGDIYWDEAAHCRDDEKIYSGSLAVISRQETGQFTLGSTPFGRRGKFFEVHTCQSPKFRSYWRQEVPWWLCSHFCTDIARAAKEAPHMPTEVRVGLFGTESLKDQFSGLSEDDFRQEFELDFKDPKWSYFSYDLIQPCTKDAEEIPVFDTLEQLYSNMKEMGPLRIGFDIGRSNHPSELYVCEKQKGGKYVVRYGEQIKNTTLHKQQEYVTKIVKTTYANLIDFNMDASGLGRHMADSMKEDREIQKKVKPHQFTNELKRNIAECLKILMEERNILMPTDRSLTGQLNSIRQKITPNGNAVFDVESMEHGGKKRHHGDKVWALGLAVYEKDKKRRTGEVHINVVPVVNDLKEIRQGEKDEQERIEAPPRPVRSKKELLASEKKLQVAYDFYSDSGDPRAEEVLRELVTIQGELEVLESIPA